MKWKKFYILSLAFLPVLFALLCSQNVSASDLTTYSQASVNFYSDSQHTATVNLPWTVNPGYNSFYLNDVYFNNNDYNNTKLAYINGRIVMEIRPNTTEDFYVCGRDASIYWSDTAMSGYCLGKIAVVYSDNTHTEVVDIPVYFTQPSNGRFNIFFDFNTALEASKQISFIQYRFYASSGYDVISRNTPWYNYQLMILVEGRSSIAVYETPPSGVDISNDLLQEQIGQNDVMIAQNDEIIDSLQSQSQQQQEQYDEEKQEETQREESGNESADEMAGVFSFSVQNPFTALFGAFTSGNTCVSIPTIAAMINSDNTQYCPWFPASVRNVLTPVLSMLSMMVIFGFVVKWLNGSGLNGRLKGDEN